MQENEAEGDKRVSAEGVAGGAMTKKKTSGDASDNRVWNSKARETNKRRDKGDWPPQKEEAFKAESRRKRSLQKRVRLGSNLDKHRRKRYT